MMSRQQVACWGIATMLVIATSGAVARAQFPVPEITKEHKLLKKDVGVWDAEMKMWINGLDQEPIVSKGTERNRMLGDYWILNHFSGEVAGQPFKGLGQFGYDVHKKKFVGTWIESMSTYLSTGEGSYDEATGELTLIMTGTDPATGKESKSKSVSRWVGEDARKFVMYMPDPSAEDKWVKFMEINYTRRAEGGKKTK